MTRVYDFQYDSLVQRTEHIYDSANRLTSQSWQIGSDSFSESYTYDATDGKLSSMTAATGAKITLTYDALKRLTTETTNTNGSELFAKSYAYRDSADTSRTTLQVTDVTYKKGGTTLESYTYAYDSRGNITKEADTQTGVTYNYAYGTKMSFSRCCRMPAKRRL